jgi:predicted phosphoribosyltransferase
VVVVDDGLATGVTARFELKPRGPKASYPPCCCCCCCCCCFCPGKTVVVVDDGLATGVTARAALQALRAKGAGRLVLAVPVGSASTVADMTAAAVADDIVCLSQPRHFRAVGQWYDVSALGV